VRKTYKTLEAMQRAGLLLLVHGEVTSPEIDLFDREAVFIERQLIPLRRDFPELKIVFEHITTKEAAQYVNEADRFTGATITAHHLLFNRNAIFTGGIRPHYYCLPVLKRETHLPVIVDPSHAGGRADLVLPLALAAIAAGADGLIVEVHPHPDRALSDGDQSLTFGAFEHLMRRISAFAPVIGRTLPFPIPSVEVAA